MFAPLSGRPHGHPHRFCPFKLQFEGQAAADGRANQHGFLGRILGRREGLDLWICGLGKTGDNGKSDGRA
ncbi:hypothetical protein D3C81_2188620 [compost metagenome]